MMSLMLWSVFLGGFILGVVAILAVEAAGVLLVLDRLNRKAKREAEAVADAEKEVRDLDHQQSFEFSFNKQGVLWILDSDGVPKNSTVEKSTTEQKRKRDFVDVSPVRRIGKIKDNMLILSDSDGAHLSIQLKGCNIEAVSATSLSSRKWAKKFPIKVESKTSVIYKGDHVFFIFVETSWEKESWCKALRLASSVDKERVNWFSKLNNEFRSYLTSLSTGYPSFMKPSAGFNFEPADKENRVDGSSSKVRLFLKRLSKKTSKPGHENKSSWTNPIGREDKKISEKFRASTDSLLSNSAPKYGLPMNGTYTINEENVVVPSSAAISRSGSQSQVSVTSDVESEDKYNIDEGTLCWNLLISRLFFDAKRNPGIQGSVQARIQRTLSNMRTPSFIGEIICTDIDTGNLPPYIHGMRVIPVDMNEVWAIEIDVEYSGGVVLGVETRLEVREVDLQTGIVGTHSESGSGEVSSDLLEGFEDLGKQLNIPEAANEGPEVTEGKLDASRISKGTSPASTTYASRWKSILNSVVKQVSQVPLSLSIRVASLRGTLRLHIKPPPSDQLWFGFTSMPDIEFGLESSVGEHKIASGQIALYLMNRFKAAIRETMVLPNCEGVCIPWMLAEKDDWVPRKVAPYMWVHQESGNDHKPIHESNKGTSSDQSENKHKKQKKVEPINNPESKHEKQLENIPQPNKEIPTEYVDGLPQVSSEPIITSTTPLSPTVPPPITSTMSFQELKRPLLESHEPRRVMTTKTTTTTPSECDSSVVPQIPSRSVSMFAKTNSSIEDDDSRPKKMGTRAKMFDLKKKMGEKFEEKKRHIEEKSRNIVEKMRGP